MKNKISAFRLLLAEQGVEMTMEQAKEAYHSAKNIMKRAKSMSMEDMWRLSELEVEGVTDEEKERILDLYRKAKELS